METVLRGVSIYLVLLLIIRISGRRTMSQMTPFDLILLLVISETTQQAMVGDDFSIINAVVLIVTLVSLDILLSYAKRHWPAAEQIIDGVPTLLIAEGVPDMEAIRKSRVSLEDVAEAARQQGIGSLDDIRYAVLEVSGHISVIKRDGSQHNAPHNLQ
jgi:uncharacterized membrane protein YcaP (DUF421 family)